MKKSTSIRIASALCALLGLAWVSMRLLDQGAQESFSGGSEPKVEVGASSLQKSVAVVTEENSQPTVLLGREAKEIDAFSRLLQNAMGQLPRQDSMRGLKHDQVHSTPPSIIAAGRVLGQVSQAWHQNEALKKPANEFYRTCSLSEHLTDTIRILCLSNWSALARDLNVEGPQDNSRVPERLLKLALYMSAAGS